MGTFIQQMVWFSNLRLVASFLWYNKLHPGSLEIHYHKTFPHTSCLSPVPPVLKGFNNTFFDSIKQLRFSPFLAEAISGSTAGDPTCKPFSFSNMITFSAVSGVRTDQGFTVLPAPWRCGAGVGGGGAAWSPCWGGFWRAAGLLDSPGGISCGHRGAKIARERGMSLPSLDWLECVEKGQPFWFVGLVYFTEVIKV